MVCTFNQMLELIKENNKEDWLLSGQWGIERETHRLNQDGSLALTPHPEKFIEQEIRKYITVDFAENQLEFVTQTHRDLDELFVEMEATYQFANKQIGNELMWPLSMPPHLSDEATIPLAKFPYLKDGLEKEVYRKGLAIRYGKKLQMISGIHYNFSFDEQLLEFLFDKMKPKTTKQAFIDDLYLKIGRQTLKYRWLLIYLFGASPVADASYQSVFEDKIARNKTEWLADLFENINLAEDAVSLRTSRFGYSTEVEDKYQVSYQHLADYISDFREIIATENKRYHAIGTERDGKKIQLNTNEFQNEAEFYSPIRFRQMPRSGETLLDALEKRGVAYFELRVLDINPFTKLGITKEQMIFTHLFMLMCLFEEDTGLTKEQQMIANQNHQLVALSGRHADLKLISNDGKEVMLSTWADQLLSRMNEIAQLIDRKKGGAYYSDLITAEADKIKDPSLLLSEKIRQEMETNGESFQEFGLRIAQKYKQSELN